MASTVGERIRLRRELNGMTITQLALAASISKGYLSELESGKNDRNPSLKKLTALAKALGTTVAELLGTRAARPTRTPRAVDPSLKEFLDERRASGNEVPETDVQLLLAFQMRSGRPQTAEEWRFFYRSWQQLGKRD